MFCALMACNFALLRFPHHPHIALGAEEVDFELRIIQKLPHGVIGWCRGHEPLQNVHRNVMGVHYFFLLSLHQYIKTKS